jgi:transcriptional regulator with XRE-family HTH domain
MQDPQESMELVKLALDNGLARKELAGRAGISESHLSRLLSGNRKPSADILFRLLQVIGGDNE